MRPIVHDVFVIIYVNLLECPPPVFHRLYDLVSVVERLLKLLSHLIHVLRIFIRSELLVYWVL